MNENDKTRKPAGFLFDQWSRYDAAARAIRAILPDGGTVLDVGSGEQMLLGAFLPDHELTYLDPLLADHSGKNLIGKPLTAASVPDGSYDVTVSVDALEHIPAADRRAFVEQLMRASKRGVVLAAPFADAGDAESTDDHINETYRLKHGHPYSWLREHEEFGLPDLAATSAQLSEAGFHLTTFGNGHTPWLKDLLTAHILLLDEHGNVPVLRQIGDRFAEDLLHFDHLEPTYRQVIVADRDATPDVRMPTVDEGSATKAWVAFRMWAVAQISRHADELTQAARSTLAQTVQQHKQRAADLQRHLEQAKAQVEPLRDEARQLRQLVQPLRDEAHDLKQQVVSLREDARNLKQDAKSSRRRLKEANARLQSVQQEMHAIRLSWSWRLSAPVRWIGKGIAAALHWSRAAILTLATFGMRLIPERMRWPLKSAFFTLLKPLLKNSREYADWQDARRWRDRPAPPPALIIAPPHDTLPDVVVFGVIDWQLRIQRPQQMALELARRGHRVIYLSPGYKQDSTPGYAISHLAAGLPIYQVHLHSAARASIYEGTPKPDLRDHLVAGMRKLFGDIGLKTNLSIVDHPGWVEIAKLVPRSQLLYDCMDNHHGFSESGSQLPADERHLIEASDAVVVTSNHIAEAIRPRHTQVPMIRNACAPDHFLSREKHAPANARPLIGYFGAIADWFDTDLVDQVASKMADCDFLLIGGDTANVQKRLAHLSNVRFVGEVDYDVLPDHVHTMDVLFIPFLINELTLATNPVKAYEALAAGKAVVATPMPELMDTDLAPFVRTGEDSDEIHAALRAALAERGDQQLQRRRVEFATQQSWSHRVDDLVTAARQLPRPRVAVVIVTWNGVALSKRCVRSVIDDPFAPELDIIIVDNASTDETPAWLDEVENEPCVRVIRNQDNRGFAAACNQGLAAGAARDADMLVILNNDIAVTEGWASTLFRHLRNDASIGLIGPVTNNIGNEAKIDTAYENLEDMQSEQRSLTGRAAGRLFDIRVLAFFCVAMPRDVYVSIGPLDENFGTGFFEDDDYCQRVRQLERRIVCAEDVFVHHELSASFDKMPSKERQELFERNKAYYESKWGPWQRHVYRPKGPDQNAAAS